MTLAVSFAQNLRRQRSRCHMTQTGLAAKAGISASYVSMLERGERSPPLETVECLADALRVDPVTLLASVGVSRHARR